MTITAVSRCSQCEAVVNIHWPSCLVCRAILPPVPGAAPPSQVTPDHQERVGEPIAPILPGWLVTYLDKAGKLSGGSEDPGHGTVQECRRDAGRWLVYLTDGQRVPLSLIRAVGQMGVHGRICAAYTVREHGYDGNGLFQ